MSSLRSPERSVSVGLVSTTSSPFRSNVLQTSVFSPCAFAKIVSSRVRSKALSSPDSLRAFWNGLPSFLVRWSGKRRRNCVQR